MRNRTKEDTVNKEEHRSKNLDNFNPYPAGIDSD